MTCCLYAHNICLYPACDTISVKIIISKTEPGNARHNDVGLCIWKSLSYIVKNMDPNDEIDRLSTADENRVLRFLTDFHNTGCTVKHVVQEPLLLILECPTLDSLNKLVYENKSDNLAAQLENCLSSPLATKLNISNVFLKTDISIDEFKLCKRKLGNEGR